MVALQLSSEAVWQAWRLYYVVIWIVGHKSVKKPHKANMRALRTEEKDLCVAFSPNVRVRCYRVLKEREDIEDYLSELYDARSYVHEVLLNPTHIGGKERFILYIIDCNGDPHMT